MGRWPQRSDQFIGRAQVLEELDALRGRGARLITLVGPPGAGKTRTALEWGQRMRQEGVTCHFLELEEVRATVDLQTTVARHFDVPLLEKGEQLGQALAALGEALIVLDNLEQVIEGAAEAVADWMERAPRCLFLCTSRLPMALRAEECVRLGPMPREQARQLFVARASGRPDEDEHLDALLEALDDLPLAIELAAARVQILPPRELLQRLQQRFALMRSRRRDLPARQATLRGAIDWSWQLLEPEEQRALMGCTVFRGGFSLADAEELLGTAEQPWLVADRLEELLRKSLLRSVRIAGGLLRLKHYESVRHFAAECLGEQPALAEQLRDDHAALFAKRARDFERELCSAEAAQVLALLRYEEENLRAAFEYSLARDPEQAATIILGLDSFYEMRGPIDQHRVMLARAREALGPQHELASALAGSALKLELVAAQYDGCAQLLEAMGMGEPIEHEELERQVSSWGKGELRVQLARARYFGVIREGSVEAFRAIWERAEALDATGVLARAAVAGGRLLVAAEGDVVEGLRWIERTIEILGQRDPLSRVRLQHGLGALSYMSLDYHAAELAWRVGLELCESLGDRRGASSALGNLAMAMVNQGRYEEGQGYLRAAILLDRQLGNDQLATQMEGNLGGLLADMGQLDEAHGLFERVAREHRRSADMDSACMALGCLGMIAQLQDAPDRARRRYAEGVEVSDEQPGQPCWPMISASWAILEVDEGQLEAAEQRLERALEDCHPIDRTRPLILALQMRLFEHMGRAEEAAALREQLPTLDDPKLTPPAHYSLALLYGEDPGEPATHWMVARLCRRFLEALGEELPPLESEEDGLDAGASVAATGSRDPEADASRSEADAEAGEAALVVESNGFWFEVAGQERVDIRRRGPARQVLLELAQLHGSAPGEGLDVQELFARCWEEEDLHPEYADKRVWAAIGTLRKLGLRELLLTTDDGYLLDPRQRVALVED